MLCACRAVDLPKAGWALLFAAHESGSTWPADHDRCAREATGRKNSGVIPEGETRRLYSFWPQYRERNATEKTDRRFARLKRDRADHYSRSGRRARFASPVDRQRAAERSATARQERRRTHWPSR